MAQFGQHALIAYEGRLADGTVFDEGSEADPYEIVIGSAQVFPKMEQALVEMEPGEERVIELAAGEAYGPYRDESVRKTPLYSLPNWRDIKEGDLIEVRSFRNSARSRVLVRKIEGSSVFLDYNHPLAGQDLTYRIKLIGLRD